MLSQLNDPLLANNLTDHLAAAACQIT